MAKKQVAVSLRKPPPADADAFVASSQEPATAPSSAPVVVPVSANDVRRASLDEVVTAPSGRPFREMTVYLPESLARKLSLHCVEADRDVSNVMAEVIDRHLAPPVQVSAPDLPQHDVTPVEVPTTWSLGMDVIKGLIRIRPWAR